MHLACHHLEFSFPGSQNPVFKDLCLDLSEPGFHALFGPSGVGKTSLAHLITGVYSPTTGKISTHGLDTMLYTHNMERIPGWANVGSHLERITPVHHTDLKNELVKEFGLSPMLKQRFFELSLGQQNRINLLRYLVQDFQMLILDESLANVDEKTRGRILLAIKAIFPEVLFLYISHNAIEVAKFCRQICILRSGYKSPQVLTIDGIDHGSRKPLNQRALQQTMLEMMNAV